MKLWSQNRMWDIGSQFLIQTFLGSMLPLMSVMAVPDQFFISAFLQSFVLLSELGLSSNIVCSYNYQWKRISFQSIMGKKTNESFLCLFSETRLLTGSEPADSSGLKPQEPSLLSPQHWGSRHALPVSFVCGFCAEAQAAVLWEVLYWLS